MEIQMVSKEAVWQLRHEVMWPDKAFDYIKLEEDDEGLHYGLYVQDRLVSVVSLFMNNKEAQFRKFATRLEEQGKGYGSRLLTAVIREAEQAGVQRIFCNARVEKTAFYKKFGLTETEQAYEQDGMKYVVMERRKINGR